MRKVKAYIAISLNGKIARADGDVGWLDEVPHPENEDYGYAEFYADIDTTVMGNKTYQQLLGWGVDFPYTGKKNYVITRNQSLSADENVTFVHTDTEAFFRNLKQSEGKDIWLIGGGEVNKLFLDWGMIDELDIHVMPMVIPDGLELFGEGVLQKLFQLEKTETYSSGVVRLKYRLV